MLAATNEGHNTIQVRSRYWQQEINSMRIVQQEMPQLFSSRTAGWYLTLVLHVKEADYETVDMSRLEELIESKGVSISSDP